MNYFDIIKSQHIDYYKGSILLRNVIEELYNPNISIQKLDLINEKYMTYTNYEDRYDDIYKRIIEVRIL